MGWITAFDKIDDYQLPGRCVPPLQTEAALADTMLGHLSSLHIESAASSVCLCGIVCTIGVASQEVEQIEEQIECGMNAACLDFSHGTEEYHSEVLDNIRTACRNYSKKIGTKSSLAVAVMTRGSPIRVYPAGGCCTEITLYEETTIKISSDFDYIIKAKDPDSLYINCENIAKIPIGQQLTVDGGRLILVCTDIRPPLAFCKVIKGGDIRSGTRVNLPGVFTDKPTLSTRDKVALRFAIENDIDIIFAAFIRTAEAVEEIRNFLGVQGREMMIISQIEDRQGLANIDEIIEKSDGIIIARKDLGNDMDQEELFLAQKSIISKCNVRGKPVICTTHMLKSMVKSPLPTRAECSDVANAVLDGADCILLRRETAGGDHVAACIKKAVSICKQAGAAVWQKQLVDDLSSKITPPIVTIHAVAAAAVEISFRLLASAIVIVASSLKSAQLLTQYRPKCPVVAVTRNAKRARQAHMWRGILPVLYKDEREQDWEKDLEMRVYYGIKFGRRHGFIRPGDPVVVLTGSRQGSGCADKMQILYVAKDGSHGNECIC